MCGIAGIIRFSAGAWTPPQQAALETMSAALAHRGPDGQGRWLDGRAGRRVALLHRRLAIIDLPGGGQPMGNEDGAVQVVFNGELYNHAELRRELAAAGHRFSTDHSDTEVLVHGWEQWGPELPGKLLGMFAFGVWDTRSDTLFLARDRIGQKPLFYAAMEDGLVFGSTIPSVLAWPENEGGPSRRVPRELVGAYLRLGFLPPPWTIYRDVTQVRPGHWVMVHGPVTTGQAYWRIDDPTDRGAARIAAGRTGFFAEVEAARLPLRQTLERAVASQLMADVPLACFLSGGIDSSIIATIMQQATRAAGGDAIHTLSVGFAHEGFDETRYAEIVAKRIGSRHTRLEVDVHHDVMGTLAGLVREQLGQPFGDSSILPTHHLSKAARAVAPVALAGDGADELFGGYDRYRALEVVRRWGRVLRHLPSAAPIGSPRQRERWRRLVYAARGGDYAVGCYPRLQEIFHAEEIAALLGDTGGEGVSGGLLLQPEATDREGLRYAMGMDQLQYLPGDILYKVDSAAMAVALEVRAPFLDHHVVEQSWWLPERLLVRGRWGKWLLREAFRHDLPPEVLTRSKKGFGVPIGEWFRGDLRGGLTDTLSAIGSFARQHLHWPTVQRLMDEHQQRRRDHTHRLFTLLMLELWWREAGATLEA